MTKTWAPLLLGATLALASPAMANQIHVGYAGSGFGPYQAAGGGEFTLDDVNPDGWLDLSGYVAGKTKNFGPAGITSFQSFCLERLETINPNTTYDATLGVLTSTLDPLSQGTAFLYQKFALGTLVGYAYDDGDADFGDVGAIARRASAASLQEAFWWLENEIALANPLANPFLSQVAFLFGSAANAQISANLALYGVQAVRLRSLPNFGDAQDTLYFNPAGITTTGTVPDGGTTLALMGFALLGIAVLARRFGPGATR